MKQNRLISWSLAVLVFLLVGVAAFQRSAQGISGLLWGFRDAWFFTREIDKSALGVNFGVYDTAKKFADSPGLAIEHIFVSWLDDNQELIETISAYAGARQRWLMITIEPWARLDEINAKETLFSDIRAGAYDTEITRVCAHLKNQGRPVLIRWGHEMDVVTGRYPWAQNNADGYVQSFRYFVAKCRSMTPDSWYVWSPISDSPQMHRYWPGGEYVDWIGLSIYGFPERDLDLYGRLRSFTDIFDEKLQRISIYQKQIMVAELGVAGEGDYQRQWIGQLFRSLGKYPSLKTLVYFNSKDVEGAWSDKYSIPDWRIASEILD